MKLEARFFKLTVNFHSNESRLGLGVGFSGRALA